VKYEIRTSDDYAGFVELIAAQKMIPLGEFWQKYDDQLSLLLNEPTDDYNSTPALLKIKENLTKVMSSKLALNKVTIVRAIGDPVIAVDSPRELIIATLDHSFEVLAPRLTKGHRIFVKDKDGLTLH
jgi:hypothetical protein